MKLLKFSIATVAVAASVAAAMTTAGMWRPEPETAATEAPPALQGQQFLRVAALGDSITLGVNACREPGECRTVSWSTGDDGGSVSLAARLGEATGHPPQTSNLAKAGAKAADLPGQADAAVTAGADFVTILVGGNDACAPTVEKMTPLADYANDVKKALTTLDAAPQQPLIFIASVPNLNGLLTAHQNNPVASGVWKRNRVCQSLLAEPASSAEDDLLRRDAVNARVNEYNQVLSDQCAAATRCIFDGGAVATIAFTEAQISDLDYFHPSRQGQSALGHAAWSALGSAIDQCDLPNAIKERLGC